MAISLNRHDYMWMQTGSNQELDFAAEEWIILPIEIIARALSNICRYNGHSSRYYSVAEHCVLISHLVPQELALAALLHDASEAYVGDMPSGLKRFMGLNFKDLEHKATMAVARGYGLSYEQLESPVIKSLDKRILIEEGAALMPPHAFWDKLKQELEPTGAVLECWTPEVANQKFLARYAELTAGDTQNAA
jgi:hypothetical protein